MLLCVRELASGTLRVPLTYEPQDGLPGESEGVVALINCIFLIEPNKFVHWVQGVLEYVAYLRTGELLRSCIPSSVSRSWQDHIEERFTFQVRP